MPKSQIIDFNNNMAQCISLRNPVHLIGEVVEDITRPGVDGHAWRQEGKRGEPFDLVAVIDFATFDDSDAADAAFTNLRGTFLSIYTDFGTHHTQLMLLKSVREKNMPALAHVGGVSGTSVGAAVVIANFRLTMVHTALPA